MNCLIDLVPLQKIIQIKYKPCITNRTNRKAIPSGVNKVGDTPSPTGSFTSATSLPYITPDQVPDGKYDVLPMSTSVTRLPLGTPPPNTSWTPMLARDGSILSCASIPLGCQLPAD